MKRFFSLLLCAAILVAVPMHMTTDVEASESDFKIIKKFDTEADLVGVTNFWDIKTRTAEANTTYKKISSYCSATMNMKDTAGQYFSVYDIGADRESYTHINYSVYATGPITVRSNIYNKAGKTGNNNNSVQDSCCISFKEGWNTVSIPIGGKGSTGGYVDYRCSGFTDIDRVSFMCASGEYIPEGFTNAGIGFKSQPNLASTKIYLDAIWLSNGLIEYNNFSSLNIENGANKVLPTTAMVKLKAPGVDATTVNNSIASITYCNDEGTDSGELVAGSDFNLSVESSMVVINFADDLKNGTTYKIAISGENVIGALKLPFSDFELSFRTLGLGENIPPQVSLVDLIANTRFFPAEGAIELKAIASDANGTIEKVEFYADETLLGEVTEPYEGVYTFIWDNPLEDANGYNIIAKAYDNGGDVTKTESVPVLVLDLKNPEVTLTSPSENAVLKRNFAGIETVANVKVSADVTCIGSKPAKAEFVLDGDIVHTATNTAGTYTHTLTNLSLGTHSLYVRVTDEYDMQGVSETVNITVKDFGKVLPGVLEENFEEFAEGDKIGWTLSGEDATLTAANHGDNVVAKFASEDVKANETVYTQKRYRNSLTSTPWEAGVRVNFADLAFDRIVEISGATDGLVLSFKTDGGVYVGTTKKADYKAGEWYDIKIVVDPGAKTLNALFDDAVVLTKTNLSATYSQNGATIKVSQKATTGKSGYVLIDDVGVYKISETQVDVSTITVYTGETPETDLDIISVSADRLTISLTEAMGSSLKNNVWVIDTAENRKLNLSYSHNTVIFGEELRGNREYKVVVTTGVSGVSGQAIAKNEVFIFKTAPKDAEISSAGFSVPSLSASVSTVTCNLDFINHSGTEHNMQIVAVVYNGNAMQDIIFKPVTVSESTPSDTLTVTVPLESYNENTFIEVFVVADLTNMTPVSEIIYKIK